MHKVAKRDAIYKWINFSKHKIPLHPIDKESPQPRTFILKDFTIYLLCHIFPPLLLLINQYADYPLEFYNHPILKFVYNKLKDKLKKGEKVQHDVYLQNYYCMMLWVALSSLLLLFFTWITISTNNFGHKFLLVERYGTPTIYFLRCLTNSYVAASSEPTYEFSYLKNFRIYSNDEMERNEQVNLKGGNKNTNKRPESKYNAHDFYNYITSQITYEPKLNWNKNVHLVVISMFLSSIPAALCLSMRKGCTSFYESFLMYSNIFITYPISVMMFRGFFQSFSLYSSMKKTMERLIKSTYVDKHNADMLLAHTQSSTTTVSDKVPEKILLNLTQPDNLRAYFYTHNALTKREHSLESKLINFIATVISISCIAMVSVIFLNLLFENHQHAAKLIRLAEESSGEFFRRMVGNIISLRHVDLVIMGYIVIVLVASIIFISLLGSGYNFASKDGQSQYLYEVKLAATMELQCDGFYEKDMSKERKQQLETVIKLVDPMIKHFDNHLDDLGILGFSYTNLYWYLVAFFSANILAVVRKQLNF